MPKSNKYTVFYYSEKFGSRRKIIYENYLHIINTDTGSISGRMKIKDKIQSFYNEFDSLYVLDKNFSLKKINISKTD